MANVNVDSNLPSFHKAFNFAWMTFKKQSSLFIAVMLTFFASWVILEVLVVAGQPLGLLFWAIAHLTFFIVFAGMGLGFVKMCLALYDEQQVHYGELFRELSSGLNFFFVQLIYYTVFLIGLALLIVPGAYLGTMYALHAFHFAEGGSNLKQCFQQSAVTSQSSRWFLFWLSVFIFLLNILGASILGVGLIITVPLSALMKTSIYRQLRDAQPGIE